MISSDLDRWTETRETLTELIAWLDDVRQWADAAAPVHEPIDDEARQAAQAFDATDPAQAFAPDHPPLDLHAVVVELTALRHEVKLQTRTARQDREMSAKSAEELSVALSQLERWRSEESARRDAAVTEARRGTAELLVDLHDAMSRASAEAERIVHAAIESLERRPAVGAAVQRTESSAMRTILYRMRAIFDPVIRWWQAAVPSNQPVPTVTDEPESRGRDSAIRDDSRCSHEEPGAIARRLEGLTAGYGLALRRIERALAEFEIEPILAVGRPVDLELMEVVQSIADPAQPSGIVIAEVRRGYRRQGRVTRFAQVVVNRGEC